MFALMDFKSDDSTIIKQADKDGAAVVMNKVDHVSEHVRQLPDESF